MTKFLLIIWIGLTNSQTLAVESFDTAAECEAARAAAETEIARRGRFKCIPYTYQQADYQ